VRDRISPLIYTDSTSAFKLGKGTTMRSNWIAKALILSALELAGQPVAQQHVGPVSTGDSSSVAIPAAASTPQGTVVVGIVLSGGLVLAADSRLTIANTGGNPSYRIVTDSANKLFDVSNTGIASYGEAFLDGRSVASLIEEFRSKNTGTLPNVDSVVAKFSTYMADLYLRAHPDGEAKPVIGFQLVGYSADGTGKLFALEFPGLPTPTAIYSTRLKTGMRWNGHIDVISRLIKGYDPELAETVPSAVKLNRDQGPLYSQQLSGAEYLIPYDNLQLQDGIDLALSLVRVTVEMERFSFGTKGSPGSIPVVGGAVDVLVVTPSELRWIRQKSLSVN
jgi:hypothetical protein